MDKYYKQNIIKQAACCMGVAIFLFCLAACSKMNATYHDFWSNGEMVYPPSPDSLKVYPGENRIRITWLALSNPSLSKAFIYWNNETDSVAVPIQSGGKAGVDTIDVTLEDMPEGIYSFNIYIFDKDGNRSVEANTVGESYGDSYRSSLLTRLINNALFVDDTLSVIWGDPADRSSIGAEISYTDTAGVTRTLQVAPGADTTVISDYDIDASHYFTYRTLFLPDSMAIDTFATAYDSVRVLGPRTLLSKSGWTATASSYDSRGGRTDRLPEKAIDNNTGTAWVNLVGSTDYPHTLTVDMGNVQNDLYGVSIYVAKRNETPSLAEIYISDNGTDWQLMGLFTIVNVAGRQYIDFQQPASFRYFRIKAEQPSGNTPNIVIYEAGVYTR